MRERRVLEGLLGVYVAALLVPAAALVSARSGGAVPGVGPLVGTFVALALLVAVAARSVDDLADGLASLPVALASFLPPFAYLPYAVIATSTGSAEAFVAIVGVLAVLPGIAVPLGGAIVRNRRLRDSATELTVVTVGNGESEGRHWAVLVGTILIGLSVVVYGALVLLEGDLDAGTMFGTIGGLSSIPLLLADDEETELAVTDVGLRIDRSITTWEDLTGYRVTDDEVELRREAWYVPARSFEREDIDDGDEEELVEALGEFLPRLDERGRVNSADRQR